MSVLTREDIEALGARDLRELLQHVPGLIFVGGDGSGLLPMAIARGFFGGGESSYVLLTVNGVPTNDARTGLAEWSQIVPEQIERVEVLRGSASVVYGDAALGAVVNIVTSGASDRNQATASARVGTGGAGDFSARVNQVTGVGRFSATADYSSDRGFRAHSASDRIASSLTYNRSRGPANSIRARLSASRMENEDAGPLTPDALLRDPGESHPAFDLDERTRKIAEASVGGDFDGGGTRHLTTDVRLRIMDQRRTRTLLLTPDFGDTQLYDESELSLWARTQVSAVMSGVEVRFGVEGETTRIDGEYLGALDPYPLLSEGAGRLVRAAAHADARRALGPRAQIHVGMRFDIVRPEDEEPSNNPTPLFTQLSPRIALDLTYREERSSRGNLFVTWSRAFKSPTLDQLYDPRLIPVGPGVTLNLSNPGLRPQRSSAFEIGVFQLVSLGPADAYAELTLSAFHQDLDDEIDFDLQTFRYGNIQESRHRGLEASVRARISPRLEFDHATTLNRVTFRSGDNEGNRLKNVPQTAFVTSVHFGITGTARLTVSHRMSGGSYIDDENMEWLDGTSLIDAGLQWTYLGVEGSAVVRNLFDARYQSLGFLLFDPSMGSDVRMTVPGRGRFLSLQLSIPDRHP